ncbi:uncharacterized protein ACN427_001623 [Glossina fuscipes fuscipes]
MFPKLLNASKINVLSLLWLVGHLLPLAIAEFFADCDYFQAIERPSSFILSSPNFPQLYPPQSSCRYQLEAPLDYEVSANCTLHIDQSQGGCSTGYFFYERLCGSDSFEGRSRSGLVALGYVSDGTRGRFQCQLHAAPQD